MCIQRGARSALLHRGLEEHLSVCVHAHDMCARKLPLRGAQGPVCASCARCPRCCVDAPHWRACSAQSAFPTPHVCIALSGSRLAAPASPPPPLAVQEHHVSAANAARPKTTQCRGAASGPAGLLAVVALTAQRGSVEDGHLQRIARLGACVLCTRLPRTPPLPECPRQGF